MCLMLIDWNYESTDSLSDGTERRGEPGCPGYSCRLVYLPPLTRKQKDWFNFGGTNMRESLSAAKSNYHVKVRVPKITAPLNVAKSCILGNNYWNY